MQEFLEEMWRVVGIWIVFFVALTTFVVLAGLELFANYLLPFLTYMKIMGTT